MRKSILQSLKLVDVHEFRQSKCFRPCRPMTEERSWTHELLSEVLG
jgi:hypothetical protein